MLRGSVSPPPGPCEGLLPGSLDPPAWSGNPFPLPGGCSQARVLGFKAFMIELSRRRLFVPGNADFISGIAHFPPPTVLGCVVSGHTDLCQSLGLPGVASRKGTYRLSSNSPAIVNFMEQTAAGPPLPPPPTPHPHPAPPKQSKVNGVSVWREGPGAGERAGNLLTSAGWAVSDLLPAAPLSLTISAIRSHLGLTYSALWANGSKCFC